MNELQYCLQQEHLKYKKFCFYPKCKFGSRFICYFWNQSDSKNHYKLHQHSFIDFEEIIKNQRPLEYLKLQYYEHMHKMNQLKTEVKSWKDKLKCVIQSIKDYIQYYKKYIDCLIFVQNQLNQNSLEQGLGLEIRQRLTTIMDYNQQNQQKYLDNQIKDVQDIISQYQNKIDGFNLNNTQTQALKLIQIVKVSNAVISQNNKWLVYVSKKRLYQYDIDNQTTKSLNIKIQRDVVHASLSCIQDDELLCLRYSHQKILIVNLRKNCKHQYQMISNQSIQFSIIQLSKILSIMFEWDDDQNMNCKIINLKNKIIFKKSMKHLIDFFYNRDNHILIFVYKGYVEQILLNSKFKKYKHKIQKGTIFQSQYCRKSNKLALVLNEIIGVLYLLDLSLNNVNEQKVQEIYFGQLTFYYFKFYENQNQLIFINDKQITITNRSGEIIKAINNYSQSNNDLGIKYLHFQEQQIIIFNNNQRDTFVFQQEVYFDFMIDSISLFELNFQ